MHFRTAREMWEPTRMPTNYQKHATREDLCDMVRDLRQQLLAIAKRYAAECRLCGGHGVRRRLDVDGVPLDDVACEQCADVRLVIARAESRSDE